MATQEELTRRIQEAAARQAEIRAAQSTAADAAASAAASSGSAQAASGSASQSATNAQQSAEDAATYSANAATHASNAAVQADRAEAAASLAQLKEVLDIAQPLRNAHVYTTQVAGTVDLSTLQIAVTADRVTRCELWVDYVSGSVIWPSLWSWVDGIEPTSALTGQHYIAELFSDGDIVVARLKLSYTVPQQ